MIDPPFVCVFCGSSAGTSPNYAEIARLVGDELVRQGLGLVYGGGQVGLMGIVADSVLAAGGDVIGVIPETLARREVAHHGITELIVVPGMHERKALMATRAGAFMTLPGGIGTLEEFFEILSWAVLGIHRKPLGLLNIGGYFDPLVALLEHAQAAGFVRAEHLRHLLISDRHDALIRELAARARPAPGGGRVDPDLV
jgi:uncharacterized protein (TIGR00730 family)